MSIMDVGTTVSWESQVRGQFHNGENGGHGAVWRVIEGLADAAQRLYLRAEVNDTRVKAAEAARVQALDMATAASADLDDFKTQVRDLLAEWVGDGTISSAVAQDAVVQLDLPPLTRKYRVEVSVELNRMYVTVEVEALSEDDARDHRDLERLIDEAVRESLSSPYDRPEVADHEVESVTAD